MALGFGFNKAKVLSSAEKFVQQGKLQNAISEYEKVIKEDPKDLTVLNTIGDLYARVGQNEKACDYFKKVGDQYAQNGFTVKAIAIYKKLSKLTTASDAILKLAELYTQQGLFNDARVHYMQVADQLLKSGDTAQAAKVLQKILELDPENTTTQSKLADLYIKLGRKDEARAIYFSAAESLYARKAFDAADEALGRVLSLDPENTKAALLRGLIAADSGDSVAAVQFLEKVPDLDSRPEGLRALIRARLQTGKVEGTESLAAKLFAVHHDLSGLASLAEWQVAHNRTEEALQLYDQYAERFFSHGPSSVTSTLYPLIARIRENPAALERMLRLLQKAGDSSHLNEVMELLAHARVQAGDFAQARDLYKELGELEPENPLHQQNYKQMLAKLGEDSMSRPLTAEEGTQALMVEELEHSAPTVHQEYTPSIEKAIDAALTDAELFISYNVPLKAIAPLEAVLPVAPRDLRLNQRLASLYVRAGRFADAANSCTVLSELYSEFGHGTEAERYAEEAKKYSARVPAQPAQTVSAPVASPESAAPEPEPAPPESAPTVREFVLEIPQEFYESAGTETPSASEPVFSPEPVVSPELHAPPEPAVGEPGAEAVAEAKPATPPAEPKEIEIDVSHEWESMLSVEESPAEEPIAAAEPPALEAEPVVTPTEPEASQPSAAFQTDAAPETVKAEPEPVATAPDPTVVEDKVQEIRFYISQGFWDMAQAAVHDLAELAPKAPELEELKAAIAAGEVEAAKATAAKAESKVVVEQKPAAAIPAAQEELVLDLPEPLPAVPAQPAVLSVQPAATASQAAAMRPGIAPAPPETEDVLGDLVHDLEESLGDFAPGGAPQPQAEVVAAAAAAPQSQPVLSPAIHVPAASPAVTASSNGEFHDSESASVLSNILSELQEDLGEDVVEAEDPETHYNLGIAFKEMGLLDEAIGELQKVCHAVERGSSFSQPVQAFTWLAQCLVDKGVPEAAVPWYNKALQLPGLDHNSRCAIYYDLGSAYEASGDKKSALANFMEVYSSNIDFRDVASRIKVLKS